MQQFGDVELRVTDTTAGETAVKGLLATAQGHPHLRRADQPGVPGSAGRLAKKPLVGRSKGVEDRNIVADTFFAVCDPGVTPKLATHDPGIYNALAKRAGVDPAKLGAELPKVMPGGFDVTVQRRTITVVPLPRRK
jgi:hypothetical protein